MRPVGDLSLTDLLWVFVGASMPYQMFTGWAEMLAGVLLIVPRTATLGALIAFADLVQVFIVNMTYDFGLKQISFHLIVIALFLLAARFPQAGQRAGARSCCRGVQSAGTVQHDTCNRLALGAQIAFGLSLIVMFTNLSLRFYVADGGVGAPKSPLYGIWDVERLAIDGEVRLPLLND